MFCPKCGQVYSENAPILLWLRGNRSSLPRLPPGRGGAADRADNPLNAPASRRANGAAPGYSMRRRWATPGYPTAGQ